MPRSTKALTAKTKHKKVLSSTKGHYGARSRLFKTAKQSHIKALQYAFRDRKNKKRNFRALWISRINAASRKLGVGYSRLINALEMKNIQINRKILSNIAVSDPNTFEKIVQAAIKNK
jgi:large subunit ribosomal protein L20